MVQEQSAVQGSQETSSRQAESTPGPSQVTNSRQEEGTGIRLDVSHGGGNELAIKPVRKN